MTGRPDQTPVQVARDHGWQIGTQLTGDNGYGPTTIQITAIGERLVLARTLHGPAGTWQEAAWDFRYRDWRTTEQAEEAER